MPSAPSRLALDSAMAKPLRVPQQQQQQQQGKDTEQQNHASFPPTPATNIQIPAPAPATSTSLEDVDPNLPQGEDLLPFPSLIMSSLFKSLPTSELGPDPESYLGPLEEIFAEIERVEASTGFSAETAADVKASRMIGSSGKSESMDAAGDEIFVAMSKQDLSRYKKSNVVIPLANKAGEKSRGVITKSPIPIHLYPNAPASALKVTLPSEAEEQQQSQPPLQQPQEELELSQQNKRDAIVAGQTALKIDGQVDASIVPQTSNPPPPAVLPSLGIPALDPISIILLGAQQNEQQKQQEQKEQQPKTPPYLLPFIAASGNPNAADPQISIFGPRDPNKTIGYNLAGVHWLLYLFSQIFLIFLLFTLFLGVLILTEFVLDREDDDLVQIQCLYWGRVVGIASATIVSAVHGSLLSGYVLLEEHTDWIAKAAVGAIVVYWVGMTWIMNRMTGPLPY
ncbi:hypothetical protein BGZ96_010548 [Linnemannia gamsii]|uniref:Uncharacterized protein n=1 Tax=Linnemannia gamsii TaxID=64522 RepID=A0ABQ7JU87_9FUNG|nr:hypothetical protein BGZ96_010548 [Linnemannia gamsii]